MTLEKRTGSTATDFTEKGDSSFSCLSTVNQQSLILDSTFVFLLDLFLEHLLRESQTLIIISRNRKLSLLEVYDESISRTKETSP